MKRQPHGPVLLVHRTIATERPGCSNSAVDPKNAKKEVHRIFLAIRKSSLHARAKKLKIAQGSVFSMNIY